jgi:hypothetical protein
LRKWHKSGTISSKGGTKTSKTIRKSATKNGHENSPILPEIEAEKTVILTTVFEENSHLLQLLGRLLGPKKHIFQRR